MGSVLAALDGPHAGSRSWQPRCWLACPWGSYTISASISAYKCLNPRDVRYSAFQQTTKLACLRWCAKFPLYGPKVPIVHVLLVFGYLREGLVCRHWLMRRLLNWGCIIFWCNWEWALNLIFRTGQTWGSIGFPWSPRCSLSLDASLAKRMGRCSWRAAGKERPCLIAEAISFTLSYKLYLCSSLLPDLLHMSHNVCSG